MEFTPEHTHATPSHQPGHGLSDRHGHETWSGKESNVLHLLDGRDARRHPERHSAAPAPAGHAHSPAGHAHSPAGPHRPSRGATRRSAAVRIQTKHRAVVAKKHVEELRQARLLRLQREEEKADVHKRKAATNIQKAIRGKLARNEVAKLRWKLAQQVRLDTHIKRERRELAGEKFHHAASPEAAAAEVVQRAFRSRQARTMIKRLKREQEEKKRKHDEEIELMARVQKESMEHVVKMGFEKEVTFAETLRCSDGVSPRSRAAAWLPSKNVAKDIGGPAVPPRLCCDCDIGLETVDYAPRKCRIDDPSHIVHNFVGFKNKNNKREGYGLAKLGDGTSYVGQWVAGFREGHGVLFFGAGAFEGEWVRNHAHGAACVRYTNGDLFTGTFQNNRKTGRGCYRWADGTIERGEYDSGKKVGWHTWIRGPEEWNCKYENDRLAEAWLVTKDRLNPFGPSDVPKENVEIPAPKPKAKGKAKPKATPKATPKAAPEESTKSKTLAVLEAVNAAHGQRKSEARDASKKTPQAAGRSSYAAKK